MALLIHTTFGLIHYFDYSNVAKSQLIQALFDKIIAPLRKHSYHQSFYYHNTWL
jgi:hypothetical protein